MNIKCVILVILIMISIMHTASAGLGDGAKIAIAEGVELFCINAADKIFAMSFSGYDNTHGTNTVGTIYNIASYTPDPMKFEVTQDFIAFSKSIFARFYPLILMFAFIAALITHYKTDALQQIEKLTGVNIGKKSNILSKKSINGIYIIVFMYAFIFIILKFNDMLTKAVMTSILETVSPTPDNFILYFIMAISYLVLGFFFSIRILVIFLFCGFAYLVGIALLIDYTNEAATNVCAYFVQTVFFQFIVVLYFSACILIIKAIVNPMDYDGQQIMYTVMLLGGIYISIKLMFGTKVIRWAGKTASALV